MIILLNGKNAFNKIQYRLVINVLQREHDKVVHPPYLFNMVLEGLVGAIRQQKEIKE